MDMIDYTLMNQLGLGIEENKYKEILSGWKCFVCKNIPEKPIKLRDCRHTFCYECVSLLRNCPKCGARYVKNDMKRSVMLSEYSCLSKQIFSSIHHLRKYYNPEESNKEESDIDKELVKLKHVNCTNISGTTNTTDSFLNPKEIPTTATDKSLFSEIKAGSSSSTEISRDDYNTDSFLKHKEIPSTVIKPSRIESTYSGNKGGPSKTPTWRTKAEKKQGITPRRRTKAEKKQVITPRRKSIERKVKTPEVEKRNTKGETSLHSACTKKDLSTVQSLLKEGANPNVKDFAGWTPLTDAVCKESLPLIKVLVEHGAWVNTPAMLNTTPLLEAVCRKNIEVIDFLLKHGADVNLRSALGNSPLSFSADDEAIHNMLLNRPELPEVEEIKPPFCSENIPTICCDVTKSEENNIFRICEELNFEVKCDFWNGASHLVTETDEELNCECTLNILKGICAGISIISTNWLLECHKTKSVVPIDSYEVKGTKNYPNTGVPRISRLNTYRLNPKLFDGCHISLTGLWQSSGINEFSRKDLISLIRDSGAVYLLRDPDPEEIPENEVTVMFHCKVSSPMASVSHVILYQPNSDPKKEPLLKYNMNHVKTLPLTWFLRCIQTFSICDP